MPACLRLEKRMRIIKLLMAVLLLTTLLACSSAKDVNIDSYGDSDYDTDYYEESEKEERIVVGFSQIGAESDWRSSNTRSMKNQFTESEGYELIFEDAQQKQTNQIMAIRSFIQQEVDYIVLAPVTETGWDTVLAEAKEAEIPVIVVDRMVDVEDDDLFTCWVGSDFELEAKKVCEWLHQFTRKNNIKPEDIHIADIQGTYGASAQIGRSKGLRDAAAEHGWDIVATVDGDFTQTKGREVTEKLLERYKNLNVIYCENDNEAFGAIEAVNASGRRVGSDIMNGEIMILSFDGVKPEALQDVVNDSISCIGECNPLHGPRVAAIIETLEQGGTPEKFEYVDEKIYSANEDIVSVTTNMNNYEVTYVTKAMVEDRKRQADYSNYTDLSHNVY